MTTPATPAADAHKFGAYADKIGHWTDGPETFVVTRAKNVRLGAQTYGPPQALARESALVAERDALRAAAQAVLAWRVGDLPTLGHLRDNDASRLALAQLAALAAPAVEGE